MVSGYVEMVYVADAQAEMMISECENQLLAVMRVRYKEMPSEQNRREWKEYEGYVVSRRSRHVVGGMQMSRE